MRASGQDILRELGFVAGDPKSRVYITDNDTERKVTNTEWSSIVFKKQKKVCVWVPAITKAGEFAMVRGLLSKRTYVTVYDVYNFHRKRVKEFLMLNPSADGAALYYEDVEFDETGPIPCIYIKTNRF